jgi:DNA-binding transcriptional LysR family regulator
MRSLPPKPHILMSNTNPLAKKEYVKLENLTDYPHLSFEQDGVNSSSNSKEPLSGECARKDIYIDDRATILNLMIELNGYMISTEIVDADLNGDNITAVPLHVGATIQVGWISREDRQLTPQAVLFLEELKAVIAEHGVKMER